MSNVIRASTLVLIDRRTGDSVMCWTQRGVWSLMANIVSRNRVDNLINSVLIRAHPGSHARNVDYAAKRGRGLWSLMRAAVWPLSIIVNFNEGI